MAASKIIRTICYFAPSPEAWVFERLAELRQRLLDRGFLVQTARVCAPALGDFSPRWDELPRTLGETPLLYTAGEVSPEQLDRHWGDFIRLDNPIFANMALDQAVLDSDARRLWRMLVENPQKLFHFAYVFRNVDSSPFFPSSRYVRDGFAVGLQSPDLAENCTDLPAWLAEMEQVWAELVGIFGAESDFLGVDSSVAPMHAGNGSFVELINRFCGDFSASILSGIFVQITNFLKAKTPMATGLCGLMLPCLEDFALAELYERGQFSIERNIFLSLHSGLGVDTYPFGVDESPEVLRGALELLSALAHKHQKPLSARFISDGRAKIGERTQFRNQYLRESVVQPLAGSLFVPKK